MVLLTATEASKILKVSTPTVLDMLRRGDLRGFSRGKVTRIVAASVEELVGEPLNLAGEA